MDSLLSPTKLISGREICGCVAIAGVTSHLAYFIRGEHHTHAPILFRSALILFGIGALALVRFGHFTALEAFMNTTFIFSIYFGSLFTSTIIYRVFSHPLKRIPGPFLVKFSKLWHMVQLFRFNNFVWLDKLHKEYGDVVRTGKSG